MNWILLALVSALFYGGYNFFLKLASVQMHQVLAAVVIQISAMLVGGIFLAFLYVRDEPLVFNVAGTKLAILAGVLVAVAEIIALYVFSRGIPVSHGAPIIVGGTVISIAILGMVALKESFTLLQWLGFAMIVVGVVLVTAFEQSLPPAG